MAEGKPLPNTRDDRQYIASLTGMRGFAALLVFFFHYEALHPGIRLDLAVPLLGPVLQFPLGFGYAGVDIFFVLSGFLLSLPFAGAALKGGPGPSLTRYFKRRFLRVFPPITRIVHHPSDRGLVCCLGPANPALAGRPPADVFQYRLASCQTHGRRLVDIAG